MGEIFQIKVQLFKMMSKATTSFHVKQWPGISSLSPDGSGILAAMRQHCREIQRTAGLHVNECSQLPAPS